VTEKTGSGKVVKTATLNIRSGPANTYSIAGSYVRDDLVTITGVAENGWYRVKKNSVTGYVNSVYIEIISLTDPGSSSFTVTEISAEGKVSGTSTLNIRSGPANTYDALGAFERNDLVAITGKTENNWYRITYNGKDGYVNSKYITLVVAETPDDDADDDDSIVPMNDQGKVTGTTTLNVRSGPVNTTTKLAVLDRGDLVSITVYRSGMEFDVTLVLGESIG